MMNQKLMTAMLLASGVAATAMATEQPTPPAPPSAMPKAPLRAELGKQAPAFTLLDIDGKKHMLADHKGRVVVLEWFNAECPYSGRESPHAIHATPKAATLRKNLKALDATLVYLIIDSTARNHERSEIVQGCQRAKREWEIDVPILIDFEGTVGHAYGAHTTPHMFVIDADGVLRYEGAFDDDRRGKKGDKATNHVLQAVSKIKAGETPDPAHTRAWGCGVKYQ